ncbi:MAG: hypothetical protein HY735_00095, partial [Verrucomicrobia bacterium]|nr:hypothetical protein [Verrucomicrobiota bacterium]
KEQPFSYGIRSRHYYDNLRRIGNVVLANPKTHPWEWIKASRMVATITGTVGIEAVYFGKPVLSFGKHQAINLLPTVRYANSFDSARKYVYELLQMDPGSRDFKVAKEAFFRAQMETSFDLPGYEQSYRRRDPQMELASNALGQLQRSYPELFASGVSLPSNARTRLEGVRS